MLPHAHSFGIVGSLVETFAYGVDVDCNDNAYVGDVGVTDDGSSGE